MQIHILLLLVLLLPCSLAGQTEKPAYCDGPVQLYARGKSGQAASLPRFRTTPFREYRIQVAILQQSDPATWPFHPSLVARYRPCEQVWVIESRESFTDRRRAEALRDRLIGLGYRGAYLVEQIGYSG